MSIGGINDYTNLWQWPSLQAPSASGLGTTATTGDRISNTGTVSSNGNMVAFMQAFSADLQSMLTQMGSDASASSSTVSNAGSTTASAAGSTDPTQNPGAVHHHHHHHGQGEGGSMDEAANQLVGEIGGATQGGTLTSSQISQSASLFATDVMQALESYNSVAPNGITPPGNSTVA